MFISYFFKDGDGYVQMSSCETNKEFFKAMGAVTDVSELSKPEKKAEPVAEKAASDKVEPKPRRRAASEG